MKTKHRTSLKYDFDTYIDFWSLINELYADNEVNLVALAGEIMPNQSLEAELEKADLNGPMGAKDQDIKLPDNYGALSENIKGHCVYQEIASSASVKGMKTIVQLVEEYLGRFGYVPEMREFEILQLRMFGLMAMVYGLYLGDRDDDIENFQFSDDECDAAVEGAKKIIVALEKGGEMRSADRLKELQYLLGEFVDENSSERISRAKKVGGSTPDYALRYMVFRLFKFFKMVSGKTETALIKSIAFGARPNVSPKTIENYKDEALAYYTRKGLLKKQVAPHLFDKSQRLAQLKHGGLVRVQQWIALQEREYAEKMKKNKTPHGEF